jgi:hypothetical protein
MMKKKTPPAMDGHYQKIEASTWQVAVTGIEAR